MQNKPKANFYIKTTIGVFLLESSPQGLTRCAALGGALPPTVQPSPNNTDKFLYQAAEELQAYLKDSLKVFSVPLDLSELTPFQQEVLAAVALIPWGHTRTYAEIAVQISQPKAVRAVGNAIARNPLMLFIPCHRVIGSNGKLHGFSAPQGVALKAWLLSHEGLHIGYNNLCAQPREEL